MHRSTFFALSLGISALLSAEPAPKKQPGSIRKTPMQNRKNNTTPSNSNSVNARGKQGPKLAEASPNIKRKDAFLSADLLYWTLYQDPALISSVTLYESPENVPGTYYSEQINAKFDWSFGLKVGLGKYLSYDNWQTSLVFSWLNTSYENTVKTNKANQYISANDVVRVYGINQKNYSELTRNSAFSYYDLVWNLGRSYFVSPKFSLLPQIGAKFTGQFNNALVDAVIKDNNPPGYLNGLIVTSRTDYKKLAVGPAAGVNAQLFFNKYWSLSGVVNTAVMYSYSSTQSVSDDYGTDFQTGIPYPVTLVNSNSYHHMLAFLEAGLFLGYNTNFSNNKYNFSAQLGWDANFYFLNSQDPFGANEIGGFDLSFCFSF